MALRTGLGTAAVLLISSVAPLVGPTSSGVLATVPITTSVLVFVHAHEGSERLIGLLRGLLTGLLATACFLALLSATLVPLGLLSPFAFSLLVVPSLEVVALHRIVARGVGA